MEASGQMASQDEKNAADLGQQAIALAEQLGRIAGNIEGTAESWMNRETLAEQLTRVRDGAAKMLEGLSAGADRSRKAAASAIRSVRPAASGAKSKGAKAAPAAATRPPDPSRAAGKRRRKPAPTMKGVKKSDESIPKLRTATAVRQRRKSYA
jgi:hypothetical protein